ncbi:hypothetical protein CR513_20684, partial [Mucuna pruriens]
MDCLRALLNSTSKSLSSYGLTMKVPQNIWILDSGATDHMTPFPSYFTSYLKKLTTGRMIGVAKEQGGLYYLQHTKIDTGTEFISLKFSKFLKDNGMVHELMCVNTPQQNGVVERKNCHPLEVARALLFQMFVPNVYWGEAIDVIDPLPFPTHDVQVQDVMKPTLVPEQVQLPEPEISIPENPIDDVTNDMPIALRKGKRSRVKKLLYR